MSIAIITGSAGLVGSEATKFFADLGLRIVGIDNDMRREFFGEEASTLWNRSLLVNSIRSYKHHDIDIRDAEAINSLFRLYGGEISLVIHTAAQPSHDWAAGNPLMDFSINAMGTLHLLEASRKHCPNAPFIFTSTNKVYGDSPNYLPLSERATRWEIDEGHVYAEGINETMTIDQSKHSLFGASKLAADVLVQEYGRYYGLPTVSFRGGCLTGPGHSGTQLHGFLAYLMKCTALGHPYRVFGYKGKQVRDNIHSADLISAFYEFFAAPRPGEVYNIGGGRKSNCSMQEAIGLCQEIAGRELTHTYASNHRNGDHIWYISDVSKFASHYPNWSLTYDIPAILREIHEQNIDRWIIESEKATNHVSV